jgi:hypothetical protein
LCGACACCAGIVGMFYGVRGVVAMCAIQCVDSFATHRRCCSSAQEEKLKVLGRCPMFSSCPLEYLMLLSLLFHTTYSRVWLSRHSASNVQQLTSGVRRATCNVMRNMQRAA